MASVGAYVGGRFQWFLPPTFLRISGSQDYNASNFTNINEFHEFWCTSDFRNIIYEFKPKWEKSQAGLPLHHSRSVTPQ